MKIGGLQRFSLIDYPGRIGATVFTQGCNFRCPYCHNPELVDPDRYGPLLPEQEVLEFLDSRRSKLEAVTVSGGEPTLQADLDLFLKQVKAMGYQTKVDTNGSRPEVIATLTESGLVDYWAMDLKGPLTRYPQLTESPVDAERIVTSVGLLLRGKVDYEFRTTAVPSLISPENIIATAQLIPQARLYVLQGFVPTKALAGSLLAEEAYPLEILEGLLPTLKKWVCQVMIR